MAAQSDEYRAALTSLAALKVERMAWQDAYNAEVASMIQRKPAVWTPDSFAAMLSAFERFRAEKTQQLDAMKARVARAFLVIADNHMDNCDYVVGSPQGIALFTHRFINDGDKISAQMQTLYAQLRAFGHTLTAPSPPLPSA